MKLYISEHVSQGRIPALRAYSVEIGVKPQKVNVRPGTMFVRLHAEDACLISLGNDAPLRMAADTTEWFEIDRAAGGMEIGVVGEPE